MSAKKAKPGKPDVEASASEGARAVRKLDEVVKAAWELFTRDGFLTTSMEAIAREARVSKATLYAYFPSKQALFGHLIVEECDRIKRFVVAPDLSVGVEEALRTFAKQYTRMFVEQVPQQMAFFRILVTEAARFPELGQLMIDSGPRAVAESLAGLLEEANRLGLLEMENPKVAATQFLCLVRGELPLQSALGIRTFTDSDIDKTIEGGLRLFLKACQPRRRATASGAEPEPAPQQKRLSRAQKNRRYQV